MAMDVLHVVTFRLVVFVLVELGCRLDVAKVVVYLFRIANEVV